MSFKKRCEKLRDVIGKIQCFGCEKVPAPLDQNRYTCRQSHYLCEDCKLSDCNCGSPIGT